jgi:Zn-dependent M28 family amino/carboxypeptidase
MRPFVRKHFRVRHLFVAFVIGLLLAIWVGVSQPILGPFGEPSEGFSASPANLKAHVQKISQDFFPRDSEHPENLSKVAHYILNELQQYSTDVAEQKYRVETKEFKNIIAKFGPSTKRVIVIGAHYDACEELPGADDNASGVAGLLELARYLKMHPPVHVAVQLVAYSTEEPPHFRTVGMGSVVHAQSLKTEGMEVLGMASLEMIGYFSEAAGSQSFPIPLLKLFYPSRGNFIAIVSNFDSYGLTGKFKKAMTGASDLPVYSMNGPSMLRGVDFSDHMNYWKLGYQAVMVTDTAFFRNEAYHTAQDTFDRLNYDKMAKVVEGVAAAIQSLDRAD